MKEIVSTALLIKFIILTISILLILIVGPFVTRIHEASPLFPFIAFIFLFDSLRELGLSINRAFEKMEWDTFVKIITSLILVFGGLILLKKDMTPQTLAIVYSLSSLGGFFAIYWVLRKKINKKYFGIRKSLILPILVTVFPFAFSSLLGSIMTNTDVYMLGLWKTTEEIGIYAASQRLYQFLLFFPGILSIAIFPVLSRTNSLHPEKFKMVLEKALSVVFLASIPITFGGIILAKEIVITTLGTNYIQSIPIFQILLIMLTITFPSMIISNAIFARNEQKIFLKSTGIGAISNVLINIILIPPLGAIGASISTIISIALSTFLMWNHIKKICDFKIFSKLIKPLLAGAVMLIVCFLLRMTGLYFMINIVISALVYGFSLYILNDKSIHDLKELLSIYLTK
jgi:O-antigen/teichoic acid export membrane protein